MFRQDTITPQFLQLVKASHRFEKNMDNHIHVVEQNPFPVPDTFNMPWLFAGFFLHPCFHALCNGFRLRSRFSITNHEKITNGIADLSQINRGNVFTFLILNSFYNDADLLRKC